MARLLATFVCSSLALAACQPPGGAGAPDPSPPHPAPVPLVSPAPRDNPTSRAKVALGKRLFFDRRLSSTGEVSCHDCHRVTGAAPSGADGAPVATGVSGLRGGRNVPTVWNAALRRALFWDGRAGSLEEQAQGPLLNPVEMGNPAPHAVVAAVTAIPAYRAELERLFGGTGIEEIARALAAYERTLVTPASAFDRFHAGDAAALTAQEKRGWDKFQARGCVACHGAPTFTGEDYFVRFPLYSIPEEDLRYGFTRDLGRHESTRAPWDKNHWRVPSLRNVARTGPYLHNGAVRELAEVVRIMGKAQLNRALPGEDIDDIVAFLGSLTGVPPDEQPPTLPE